MAASTIGRRLSTTCGFYRFVHIDGRISSNPAQYLRRPTVYPSERRELGRGELGRFLFSAERFDHAHAALAVLFGLNGLRVSEACETNIEDTAFEGGHRALRIDGKGNKPALIPLVPRSARTIDLAVGERREGAILFGHDPKRLERRTAHRPPPTAHRPPPTAHRAQSIVSARLCHEVSHQALSKRWPRHRAHL